MTAKNVVRHLWPWVALFLAFLAILVTASAMQTKTTPSSPPSVYADTQASPEPSVKPTAPRQPIRNKAFLPQAVVVGDTSHRVHRLPRVEVEGGVSSPVPPGKDTYAWDEESAKPGSSRGVAIFTAHTYSPPEQALGNQLLARLKVGGTLAVKGRGVTAVYRVTKQFSGPVGKYPDTEVDDMDGPPRLAITVCSGTPVGPGDWTERTVWFASLESVK